MSDDRWQCIVIHTAPLDKSCESESSPVAGEGACGFQASSEPTGWDTETFDVTEWPAADIYSEAQEMLN